MIERQFVKQNVKERMIHEFITKNLSNVGHSNTRMIRTPLGEKIIVYASRPGLVVGREGQNIKKITAQLKKKFKLENPQMEISEVENINLDSQVVAERIASALERFGSTRFKGVGHKVMTDVMGAGALGIEIVISGKIPSARARSWRFYSGYLKKCGDIALTGVDSAYARAELKSGTVGIKVKIMPPDIKLPDKIELIKEKETIVEEVKEASETKEVSDKAKVEEKEENLEEGEKTAYEEIKEKIKENEKKTKEEEKKE
jgi:small subunit ribosomal protein S3